jgi:fatty-acyl-CoA synthase
LENDQVEFGLGVIDNTPAKAWARALEMSAPIAQAPTTTLPVLIDRLADRFGSAPALLSEHRCLTYSGLAELSRRYAVWALRHGIAFGDVVCLMMPNCTDYLAIWLGITRVGGIVSLINTQLVGDSLARSISAVAAKCIIVDAQRVNYLVAVQPHLPADTKIWVHGENKLGFPQIEYEIARTAANNLANYEYRLPTLADRALYIHTSGTTGLPKAANVSHFRLMQWSHWFAGMMHTRPDDRMYDCLPMYHAVGGVVAIGAMLVNGGSVAIREGFSLRRFWDDIVDWNCTLFQYLGELCRYLVNSARHPRELDHRLRLCCGNGLNSVVWEQFKYRFRVPRILEFYAATEGTFSLYNFDGRPGAIGKIPSYLVHRFPMALVKFDFDREVPKRNDDGFCIRCAFDEVGEAIGRIGDNERTPGSRFEGYSDPAADEQKLLRNVFVKGDLWFCTGDLMRQDKQGYFHFVDRVGDTFRWKGENVSTSELAQIISQYPGVSDAIVYGVTIPGNEGRAGMVTAVVVEPFDLAGFHRHLAERLPRFARPLFLRITDKLPMTTSFKPQKQELRRQGYDPSKSADPIYFNDRTREAFIELDSALYERIRSGEVRV